MSVELLPAMPQFVSGDEVAGAIGRAAAGAGIAIGGGDIVVIAQKIVSKAEGRFVALDSVVPSEEALRLAAAGERTVIFPTRMNLKLLDEAFTNTT